MSGFGCGQGHGDGLGIAHFANQDHIGILAKDGAQGAGEAGRVGADLDLLDHGVAVGMDELDGIFNGNDMITAVSVDEIDQRGQRGTFAASGGSGDQDQALPHFGQAAQAGRQMERFERRDFFGKHAKAAGDGASLVVDVGAETANAFAAETEVGGFGALQFLRLSLSQQGQQELAGVIGGERGTCARGKRAAYSQGYGGTGD